ncbi:hypothetical protein ACLOJK_033089 [Asimina triloba]
MQTLQADARSALHFAAAVCYLNPIVPSGGGDSYLRTSSSPCFRRSRLRFLRPIYYSGAAVEKEQKPYICTADELHYVAVPATEWRLALWRYKASPKAPRRNHPLLLLSGVGTNAIGFDLAPESSFARYMSSQGFDTWILELRGAGLSKREGEPPAIEQSANVTSEQVNCVTRAFSSQVNNSALHEPETSTVKASASDIERARDESQLASRLSDILLRLAEQLSGFLSEGQSRVMSAKFIDQISKILEDAQLSERFNEIKGNLSGLLETRQSSAITNQVRELSQRIVNIVEGQHTVSPQFFDLQDRFSTTIEDFWKQLDLIVKYNWDFDNYLEEDVPAALLVTYDIMDFANTFLDTGFEGRQAGLAAVVTLGSSLDYTPSNSSLKLLLPLADPAQALNVPVVPIGALLAAAYPLSTRPPYVLSWLNPHISAEEMMHPELFERLLVTAFRDGGLRDRSGTFLYKDHLHKSNVPILAIAGDRDLICPPEAVYETVKIIPPHLVQYKIFGKPDGPHYGHYDIVGGRLAIDELYPCIVEFLSHHDGQRSEMAFGFFVVKRMLMSAPLLVTSVSILSGQNPCLTSVPSLFLAALFKISTFTAVAKGSCETLEKHLPSDGLGCKSPLNSAMKPLAQAVSIADHPFTPSSVNWPDFNEVGVRLNSTPLMSNNGALDAQG